MSAVSDLLLGRAFWPDIADITVPLARRMAGRRLVVVSGQVGRPEAKWLKLTGLSVSVSGEVTVGPLHYAACLNEAAQIAEIRAFATSFQAEAVAVSLVCALLSRVSQRVSADLRNRRLLEALNRDGGRVFGWPGEPGLVWSCVCHPKLSSAVTAKIDRKLVQAAQRVCRKAGLSCVRVQVPMLSILQCVTMRSFDLVSGPDFLAVGDDWAFYLPVVEGDWPLPLEGRAEIRGGSKGVFDCISSLLRRDGRRLDSVVLVDASVHGAAGFLRREFASLNVVVPPAGIWPGGTPFVGTDVSVLKEAGVLESAADAQVAVGVADAVSLLEG
jgi:hypothetical protein